MDTFRICLEEEKNENNQLIPGNPIPEYSRKNLSIPGGESPGILGTQHCTGPWFIGKMLNAHFLGSFYAPFKSDVLSFTKGTQF